MTLLQRNDQNQWVGTSISSKGSVDKHYQLNRFLSKTFHMVNNCDRKIVSWDPKGNSFVVENIEQFSKKVLPSYFNHSKFSSFVRQLNFYGFRKLSVDSSPRKKDDERHSVRFYHENFQMDRPDLLHKIRRTTKPPPESTKSDEEIEMLQKEVDKLRDQIHKVHRGMETKINDLKQLLETEYESRICKLEMASKEILLLLCPTSTTVPLLHSFGSRFVAPTSFLSLSTIPQGGDNPYTLSNKNLPNINYQASLTRSAP